MHIACPSFGRRLIGDPRGDRSVAPPGMAARILWRKRLAARRVGALRVAYLLLTRLTDLTPGPLEDVGGTEDWPSAPTPHGPRTSAETRHELLMQRAHRDPDAHLFKEERRNVADV